MRPFVALLAGVMLFATFLIPIVSASHTMGHRYLVYGRILDANGLPVQQEKVHLRILSTPPAAIDATTDCLGDFESWRGEIVPPQGSHTERNQHEGEPYVAFHYHDPELSDQYDIEVRVANDTWIEEFHSSTRQTAVHHQLSTAMPQKCPDYKEFNTTFTARVSILSRSEMSFKTEEQPKARNVQVRFGPSAAANGTTDFNGAFVAKTAVTLQAGDQIRVTGDDMTEKVFTVDATVLKFRRVNSINVVAQDIGSVVGDLKYVGIGVLVIAAAVGAWFGGSKLRDRMAERRLREYSTRRRFRKRGPE